MPNGITRETFINANTDSKLSILYDMQNEMINAVKGLQCADDTHDNHCKDRWLTCDDRFKKLEKNWYKVAGGLLILATIAPFISTLIIKYWI